MEVCGESLSRFSDNDSDEFIISLRPSRDATAKP